MHNFRPHVIGDKWLVALQTPSTTKELNQCVVCRESSDQVALHYSRMLCNGCRAFFKRAIQGKVKTGDCKAEGRCIVDANSRKSCKACRFEACIRAGVDASKVQTVRESSMDAGLESGSGSTARTGTPHNSFHTDFSQESGSAGSRQQTTQHQATSSISQTEMARPLYYYSNYPQQTGNNSRNIPPGPMGISAQLPFPPAGLHGNNPTPFAGMPNSGITFVSYPQTQNAYLSGPAVFGNYLGSTTGLTHAPSSSGQVNLGQLTGIGQYPTLLPTAFGQSLVPSGVPSRPAYNSDARLVFHPNMDTTKSYPALANPYPMLNGSGGFYPPASPTNPMVSSNTDSNIAVKWKQEAIPNTRDNMYRTSTDALTPKIGRLNPSVQTASANVIPDIPQEKGETQVSYDVANITSGLGSTSLSNFQNFLDTQHTVEGSRNPSGHFKESKGLENPRSTSKFVGQCEQRVKGGQDTPRDNGDNSKTGALLADSSHGSTHQQESSSTGSKKSFSFSIEDILGPRPVSPWEPELTAYRYTEKDENHGALTILPEASNEAELDETELTIPTQTNKESVATEAIDESSHSKHLTEAESNSSQELNVVDVTLSEEIHPARPAHHAEEIHPARPAHHAEEIHPAHPATRSIKAVKADPATPQNPQNEDTVGASNLYDDIFSVASGELDKIPIDFIPQDHATKTSPEFDETTATASPSPTIHDNQGPNHVQTGETTGNKPEHKTPRQELFPLCDSPDRVGHDDPDSNDSSTDSIFWNSSELTPSKRQNRDTPVGSANKTSPAKPGLSGAGHIDSPRYTTKNLLSSEKSKQLISVSPKAKLLLSPSKRRNHLANSENLTPQGLGNFKDSPSERKCLEEIPENSLVDLSAVNASSDQDFKEPHSSRVYFNSARRRARCLAFSSSSEDDVPKPRPKRRPTPKKPRPKYTSTPLVPPTCQARVANKSYNFQDILQICGEFFQRELLTPANSSASLSSSPPPTSQPCQAADTKLPDQSLSSKPESSPPTDTQTSADSVQSTSATATPSSSQRPEPPPATATVPSTISETSDKTGSGEGSADSGIASILEQSGLENSSAFLESIRSKVMADPTYTMDQFKQDVLEFHRLSSSSTTSQSNTGNLPPKGKGSAER